jgi:serine/threonine-protein kinase
VLHRDLKPANVFLVRRPEGGETVKIIDFGISKLTRAAGDYTDVTSASKVVGTPCYMAPEQARGAALDARTDVYSLGVMLFEMLVGERPFTGRSALEILIKHLEAPRVAPSQLRPELVTCPGLDALVLRALASSAAQRFRSMEELGEAIVACLRAIDPVAAERATEITGELVAPTVPSTSSPEALGWQRRGVALLGIGVVAGAAMVLALTLRARGGERVHPGAPDGGAPARAPAAAPRSTTSVIEPPAPAPVVVRVTSRPVGASVRRDGAVLGVTPIDLVLTDEPSSITVAARGYHDRRVVLDGAGRATLIDSDRTLRS